jgi:hypothetical protein
MVKNIKRYLKDLAREGGIPVDRHYPDIQSIGTIYIP